MAVGRTLPVSETIWLDSKIRKLQNSDKFLFLYLLTNSHVEYVGIYELTNETIKYETFLNDKNIISGLERLKNAELIDYDEETSEIAILNYLKYSISAGGNPIKKRFMNLSKKIKSVQLMEKVYAKTLENKDERDIYLFAQEMLRIAIHYKRTGELIKIDDDENPYSNNKAQKKQEKSHKNDELVIVKNGDSYRRCWVNKEEAYHKFYKEDVFEYDNKEKTYKVYEESELSDINKEPYDK